MSEEEVERKSLEDLRTVLERARKEGITLAIIGGYAVAAYTRGYRYTKDIDLVADKPEQGRLKGLLKSLDYSVRDTDFGLAGIKKLNGGFVDIHMSVGTIFDVSTGREYPIDSTFFKNARYLKVRGYISKTPALKAPIVELETLIVLKTMTIGRNKDAVDLLSLLLDKRPDIDLATLAQRTKSAGLTTHLLDRIRDFASRLRGGDLDKVWFEMTGTRLPFTDKRKIVKLLSRLADLLRKP